MTVDFGGLTEEPSARPIPYLLPHAWPYRPSAGDAMGTQDPGVVEGVVMCKDLPAVLPRDIWERRAT